MQVKDAMNSRVKTIRPDSTVYEASRKMNEHRIGSLIVITGTGSLAGILTERDIMRAVVAENLNSKDVKVEDIMSKKMAVIDPEASLEDAAEAMNIYKIKRLPVIKDGALIGIITTSDLIAYESKLIEHVAELITSPKNPQGGAAG